MIKRKSDHRQTGKTTWLFEQIIDWQAENDGKVYFLNSASYRWGRELTKRAHELGITDIDYIRGEESLRGINSGLVALDDAHLAPSKLVESMKQLESLGIIDLIYTTELGSGV